LTLSIVINANTAARRPGDKLKGHSGQNIWRSSNLSRSRSIPNPSKLNLSNARSISASPAQIPPQKSQKNQQDPRKASSSTPTTRRLVRHCHPPHHQYNPCRGSSIGRACGSYDSKEINLKVVGSSPTFGYSYIKVFPCGSSCSFALFGRPGRRLFAEDDWKDGVVL
jgi:hypothetical protein